jgi:DNA-directed RNA polymerase specialized sigma24 family protein
VDHIEFPDGLLERAKAGDTEAFQDLYARARIYALRIGVACFSLRAEDAEDIAQEATWSLHQNLSHVERPDSWLYAAVRHLALRIKAGRRDETSCVDDEASPHKDIGMTDIWDCVLRLSDRCRRLILNLFYCGYTERELAGLHRIHKATIHKRKRTCFGSLFELYLGDSNERCMLHAERDSRTWRGRAAPGEMPDLP